MASPEILKHSKVDNFQMIQGVHFQKLFPLRTFDPSSSKTKPVLLSTATMTSMKPL